MIVQPAPEGAPDGQPAFVITMDQHTAFAGALARVYGNERFARVEPREEMLYMIEHHDAGWRELDARALRDPDTGLPYHLVQTPFERIVETSAASPDFNSRRHAFCGLLSSMHSWGLYNGRYGMSDMVLLDALAEEHRARADAMLDGELARQELLKTELAGDAATAPWIEPGRLLQCYKQLQFFDTAALYFHCTPETQRSDETFTHVPLDAERDLSVRVERVAEGRYAFAPYPFAEGEIELGFEGRYLAPGAADGESLATALYARPVERQTVRLVRGD